MKHAKKRRANRLRSGLTVEIGSIAANLLTLILPLVMIQLFDRVIPNAAGTTLTVLAAVLLGTILIEAVLRYAVAALLMREGTTYALEAERRLLHQVLHARQDAEEPQPTSRHLEAWDTIERLRHFHAGHGRHSAVDLPFALLFIGVFGLIAPPLLPILSAIVLLALLASRLHRGSIRKLSETRRDQALRTGAFNAEVLNAAEHVKGLSVEALMMRRQESLAGNSALINEQLSLRQSVSKSLVETLGQATPVLVAVSGAFWVNAGSLSTGALAAAILLSGRIVQPVLRACEQIELRRILAPRQRELHDIIDAPAVLGGLQELPRIDALGLENVSAKAPDGREILTNVSLALKAGDCVAISGASGSGKSTLMRLLSGRLAPSEGRLIINGTTSEIYRSDHLADEIAVMSQKPRLLSGTLLDAITSNRGEHVLPEALRVTEELGLSRFLASRSDGFLIETHQGAGRGLPGAVAGLLPIIAALARKPSVLLFDEANGMLDRQSDARLHAALERRLGSAIIVMVTQRPSFAGLANRRFHLEGGRLTELPSPQAVTEMAS